MIGCHKPRPSVTRACNHSLFAGRGFLVFRSELFPRFRWGMVKNRSARPLAALDTECTGLHFHRGAFPYAVAVYFDKPHPKHGRYWFRQWPVDPFSRAVKPLRQDILELKEIVNTYRIVFHNAKFDIRALECLGVGTVSIWENFEDTLLASHVADASESHRLKDLGIKYLEILDDDEDDLRNRVKSIRLNEARTEGWAFGEDIEMDYWMPTALTRLHPSEAEHTDSTLLREYNIRDVQRTMLLWRMYTEILPETTVTTPASGRLTLHDAYCREKRLHRTVYRMEKRGVTLVNRKLKAELKRYSSIALKHERICNDIAVDSKNWVEINLNSTKQLQELLFNLPVSRTRKHAPEQRFGFGLEPTKITSTKIDKTGQTITNYSLDKHELPLILAQAAENKDQLAEKFLHNLLAYRKNEKAAADLNGYYQKMVVTTRPHGNKKDYRLHGSLNQTGTQTTRFSHSDPNTANISKGDKLDKDDNIDFTLREVFGPSWGRIWYAFDYNQLQLRIFAHVAGEEEFIKALRAGYDAHTWVATQIFDCSQEEVDKYRRRIAKNVNFGFIFGAGERKIDYTSGIKGLSTKIAKLFPAAHDFMRRTISFVRRNGYVVTLGGYKLPVSPSFAYAGVCYIVQGTEGDIVKNAMISVDNYLERETADEYFMTLQVHDELVFDFPKLGNRHEAKSSLPKRHRLILGEIARRMIAAGANLGVETPVNCEKIVVDYANGVPQELGELYVRSYQKSGRHIGQHQIHKGGRYTPADLKRQRYRRRVHKV